jgi:two-component system sensor histidine kinase/response regulator
VSAPPPTAEAEPLGRMMRDLVALSVLPNVWHRSEPLEVAQSLAVVLEKTLPLAVVGVLVLESPDADRERQVVRSEGRLLHATEAEAVVRALRPAFGSAERAPETIDNPFGRGALRLVCLPIAWQAGRWLLFAASEGANFPSSGERMLLNAGANHAAVALERRLAFRLLQESEERFRQSEERWREVTRQTQESAESANRGKDELLANVSHEIRTPMNAILGMTELALGSQLTDEQRGWLQTVKLAGEHLLALVDGLLDFSKGEARKATLDSAPFSLRSELTSMMRAAAVRAQHKDLELICDVDDSVAEHLVGDAGKLRQVLLNLVDNAIKFTEHGEVQVLVTSSAEESTSAETKLTFSVSDTGIGVPSHLHALIFEPFAQADSSTTRRFGGTGLGLTIAASLTALMGGNIVLSSEPNVGSTFTFCVGFRRAQENTPTSSPRERPWPGVSALVVDGNLAARALLVRWLSDWQMEASGVADGLSAMQTMLASAQCDRPVRLLLVDGSAPGMPRAAPQSSVRGGVAHELRLLVVEPGIGAAGPGVSREVVIPKPIVKGDLYAAIRRLLSPGDRVLPLPSPSGAVVRTAESRRVLVAEDNEFNIMLARELLSRRGHEVYVVQSGADVLAELDRQRYDVLLLDLHMPEMDGFEVIRMLRAREQLDGGHLPVIALTARARPADRERCLAAGMDDFLPKPINSAALLETLERVSLCRRPADPNE